MQHPDGIFIESEELNLLLCVYEKSIVIPNTLSVVSYDLYVFHAHVMMSV